MGNIVPVTKTGGAPAPFGEDHADITIFTVDLTKAKTLKDYAVTGTFIWAIAATSLTANLTMFFQDQKGGAGMPWKKGEWISGLKFSRLFWSNAAQPGESITFLVVKEGARSVNAFNPSSDLTTVTLALPTIINSFADVSLPATTKTIILAANSDRQVAHITNLSSNPREIRVGDFDTGAARGRELLPGETMEIAGTESIWGYNPHSSGMEVSLIWVAN